MADKTDRRSFLNKALLGAAGVGAAASLEENILLAAVDQGQATPQQGSALPQPPKVDVDPASMPCGKIGNVTVSRLLIGGNLIGGWAHSRDLMYASNLFRSYNTEAKIFETLELAQACGVNTIQLDPVCWGAVTKYNRHRSTKIQTMVCVSPSDSSKTSTSPSRRLNRSRVT